MTRRGRHLCVAPGASSIGDSLEDKDDDVPGCAAPGALSAQAMTCRGCVAPRRILPGDSHVPAYLEDDDAGVASRVQHPAIPSCRTYHW